VRVGKERHDLYAEAGLLFWVLTNFLLHLLADILLRETELTYLQIQPGDIPVTSIADKVSNGEIWILGGCLV
jgi:hypothetical protein